MRQYKIFKKIAVLLSFCIFFIINGCKKDFLDVKDLNNFTINDVKTPDGLRGLHIAMFSTLASDGYQYFWPLYLSHCAGEYKFIEPTGEGPNHEQMWSLNYSSTNEFMIQLYASDYQQIAIANRIIDFIDNSVGTVGTMPKAEQDLILGSAYFMRGFNYFQLLHTWGNPYDGTDKWGVVLTTKVITNPAEVQTPRAKVSEVYSQIESDFENAKKYLPSSDTLPYVGNPTKAAASAWLGKTYVFEKKYANAIAEFTDFETNYLKTNKNGLLPKFGDNFHGQFENDIESLFEVQYADITTTTKWSDGGSGSLYQAYIGGPGLARGNVAIPPVVFADFIAFDQRRAESRFIHLRGVKNDSILVNGKVVIVEDLTMSWKDGKPDGLVPLKTSNKLSYAPKKYINKLRASNNFGGMAEYAGDENQMITRIAEVYFLYAEALIEGGGNLSTAREYLNKITRRAFGFDENTANATYDLTIDDANTLRTHLRADKRKEFIGEGIRWYDMIRWDGTYGYSIAAEVSKTGRIFGPKAVVWPVPKRDQESNFKMEQYPGY